MFGIHRRLLKESLDETVNSRELGGKKRVKVGGEHLSLGGTPNRDLASRLKSPRSTNRPGATTSHGSSLRRTVAKAEVSEEPMETSPLSSTAFILTAPAQMPTSYRCWSEM